MNQKYSIILLIVLVIIYVEGKRSMARGGGSRSGRGSSKKTNSNPQPAPTSFSYSQPSAAKPSLSGWQERPAQKSNTQTLSNWQSKPSNGQSHSYPSSGTGLSGDKSKPPANQETVQRSSAPNINQSPQQTRVNNQQSHSYPASTGMSGSPAGGYPQQNVNKYPQQQATGLSSNAGSGQHGYPQGSGMSGSGSHGNYPQQPPGSTYQHQGANPQQHAASSGAGYAGAPPPYPGQNNYGYNNFHPQGPPPPYSHNSYYGGFGGHGSYNPGYTQNMPGYFGNYGKNSGGLSRTGSTLTGVGIAGAGIGTVLTGLALWNLARSTGHQHHTVIYDNRGQPVAVAPANDTASVPDSILSDLVNCSLTISNDEKTEVLAIPCAIATSFTPNADVKEAVVNENKEDKTKCIVTVLTKMAQEFMTTIPCSILLSTAAENNVTEPPIALNENQNTTFVDVVGVLNNTESNQSNEPTPLKLIEQENINNNGSQFNSNCSLLPDELKDPINPCYPIKHNLTVIPLPS